MHVLFCLFVWKQHWNEMKWIGARLSISGLDISMAFLFVRSLLLIHRYVSNIISYGCQYITLNAGWHIRACGFIHVYKMCASPIIFDRLCDNLICREREREPLFDQFISKWTSNRVNWKWLAVWHFIQSLRFCPFLSLSLLYVFSFKNQMTEFNR